MAREIDPLDALTADALRGAAPSASGPSVDPLDALTADALGLGARAPAAVSTRAAPEPKRQKIVLRGPERPPTAFEPGARTDSEAVIPGGEASLIGAEVGGRTLAGIPSAITGVATFPYEVGKASAGAIGQAAGDALFPAAAGQREQAAAIGVAPKSVRATTAPSLTDQYGKTAPNPWEKFVGDLVVDKFRTYAPKFDSNTSTSAFAPPPPMPSEKVGLARQIENPWGVITDALMVAGAGARTVPDAARPMAPEVGVAIERHIKADTAERVRGNVWESARVRVSRGAGEDGPRSDLPPQQGHSEAVWEEQWRNFEKPQSEDPAWEAAWGTKAARGAGEARKAGRDVSVTAPPKNRAERRAAVAARIEAMAANKNRAAARRADRNGWNAGPIQAGDSATLRVGDVSVDLTPEHTLDPILRQEANAAVEAARPSRSAKPGPYTPPSGAGPDPASALRPNPLSAPVRGADAVRPAAPATGIAPSTRPVRATPSEVKSFVDAQTGRGFAVRFSGEASQSQIALERAQRVRDLLQKEKGAVNFGPVLDAGGKAIDYAAERKDRAFAILRDAAVRGSTLAGRTAKLVERVENIHARRVAREAFDAWGKRNVSGAKAAVSTIKGGIDAKAPAVGRFLDSAERLRRGIMDPEGANVPDEFSKIQRTQQIREAEPRLRQLDAIITDLEKADPKAIQSLIFERVFDSLPQRDPALQAAVNHANPAIRRLWDLMSELGLRKQWHGQITQFTREHGEANWLPHRPAQEGRKTVIGGLRERGIVDRTRSAPQGYRKGRKGNDVGYWERAENTPELVFHIINEIKRQHEILDQMDVNAQAAFDPMVAVPVQHLVNEKNIRVAQGTLVDSAIADGAKTVSDALSSINDQINDKILSLDRANAKHGLPANTAVRMDSAIGRLHQELNGLFDAWEHVAMLRNQGITDLQTARAEIAKAKSAVEAEILDVPNKVAALSKQTGQTYIHIGDAFANAGSNRALANDQRLGMLAGGWVNERMQEAVPYMIREPDGPLARSFTAMTGLWKMGQVAYNKTSWVNNGQATSLVSAMNGFPLTAQPSFTVEALSQLLDHPEAVAEARIAGLEVRDTHINAEVRQKLDKHLGTADDAHPAVRLLERANTYMRHTKVAQGYGLIDDSFRLGAYNYNVRVRGMSPEAAAKDANFAVVNATKPPRLVKKFSQRAVGLGPAFLSTTMQMPPRVVQGTLRNPLLAATIITSPWWTRALAKAAGAQSDADAEARARHRPFTERASMLAAPWRTGSGAPGEISMAQWNPYTSMNPLGGRGPGGPLQSLYDAYTNAPDPDTGRRSTDPTRRALSATLGPESARMLDVARAMSDDSARHGQGSGDAPSMSDSIIAALSPWRGRAESTDRVVQAAAQRAQAKQDQLIAEFMRYDEAGKRAHQRQLEADIQDAWRSEGFDAQEAGKASGAVVAPKPTGTITLRPRR